MSERKVRRLVERAVTEATAVHFEALSGRLAELETRVDALTAQRQVDEILTAELWRLARLAGA
jgi:hypothetical protein